MAFNSITTNGKTFNSIGTGVYQLSTVAFGNPNNLFKVTGGKKSGKSAPTTASVSRHVEKDVVVGTATERRKASLVLQMTIPEGFSTEEVDALSADIDLWLDGAVLSRLLMGEQ